MHRALRFTLLSPRTLPPQYCGIEAIICLLRLCRVACLAFLQQASSFFLRKIACKRQRYRKNREAEDFIDDMLVIVGARVIYCRPAAAPVNTRSAAPRGPWQCALQEYTSSVVTGEPGSGL
jgi:hypothetical protein